MEYLPDVFTQGDDENTGCYSIVACTWLILYKAVPAGDISGVLAGATNQEPGDAYLLRFLFELVFFIVVSKSISSPRVLAVTS